MAYYAAYFDAAGSFNPKYPNNSKYAVVVSGYASSMHRWKRFDQRWNAVLAEAGIRIPFHMTDFMANQAGFENWRGRFREKEQLLFVLARLIRRSSLFGIGEAVLISEWNRANEVFALAQNHCTPYAMAGYFVVHKAMGWIGRHSDQDIKAQVTFESGDSGQADFKWVMDRIRRRYPVLSPTYPQFANRGAVTAFQACDFVAWEKRRAMGHQFFGREEQYTGWSEALSEVAKIEKDWGYIDYDAIVKFCERYDMPRLGESRRWGRGLS